MIKDVILHPKRAFEEISENGGTFLIGALLIVVLPNAISASLYVDYSHLKGVSRDVAEWLISVVLLYFIGKALKGETEFLGLMSAIGYARFPLIFPPIFGYFLLKSIPEDVKAMLKSIKVTSHEQAMYVITHMFTPVTITLALIVFALIVWSFALSVIAVRESNKFSTWKAFCSVVVAILVNMLIVAKLLKATAMINKSF